MKGNDRARPPRTLALGRAIRRHRGEMAQGDLAPGLGVSQASISSWELGGVDLTCEQVAELERRLGLVPGTLFVEAGYVDPRLVGVEATAALAVGLLEHALHVLVEAVAESGTQGS